MPFPTLEIVGSGFSLRNYWKSAEITWAICNTMHCIPHNLGIFMDDLEHMDEFYKGEFIKLFKPEQRVLTCKAYDRFPMWQEEYPLDDVLQFFGIDWLNNSVAYALAYAAFLGFTEIHLHGIDYFVDGDVSNPRMMERRCTEMWINHLRSHHGVVFKINPLSFLFDTNKKHLEELAPEVSKEMLELWRYHESSLKYLYGYQSGLPELEFNLGYNKG